MTVASLLLPLAIVSSTQADYRGTRMMSFKGLESLSLVKEEGQRKTYSVIAYPEVMWDEMVPSWNIDLPPGGVVMFKAKGITPGGETKAYNLGIWSIGGMRQ